MFKVQALAYDQDALEPIIGAGTMEVHYGKHYAGYTTKLNAALEGHADLQEKSITDLLSNLEELPSDIKTAVRNNGGGYLNHTIFFDIMGPASEVSEQPEGDLLEAIEDGFGSVEDLQDEFNAAAKGRFGSGWAWLVVNAEGELEVMDTPNQDNPVMLGDYTPILGLDVWEHAYYLDYQNDRGGYVESWWQIVDWDKVTARYEAATK